MTRFIVGIVLGVMLSFAASALAQWPYSNRQFDEQQYLQKRQWQHEDKMPEFGKRPC